MGEKYNKKGYVGPDSFYNEMELECLHQILSTLEYSFTNSSHEPAFVRGLAFLIYVRV